MAVICANTLTSKAPAITIGELCGHPAERFAEIALQLEPAGEFWCKQYSTIKASLYRAFGGLLATFNERLCDLLRENTACQATETLGEWESEFGLPSACQVNYPTDIAGRQAQVCAARRGSNIRTMKQLEQLLQAATNCPHVKLENYYTHSPVGGAVGQPLLQYGGVCVRGVRGDITQTHIHNVVGGYGLISFDNGSAIGQPLTIVDPSYTPSDYCPMIYHSVVGGWTGGVGTPLTQQSADFETIICLMQKHLPAHVSWFICED